MENLHTLAWIQGSQSATQWPPYVNEVGLDDLQPYLKMSISYYAEVGITKVEVSHLYLFPWTIQRRTCSLFRYTPVM